MGKERSLKEGDKTNFNVNTSHVWPRKSLKNHKDDDSAENDAWLTLLEAL